MNLSKTGLLNILLLILFLLTALYSAGQIETGNKPRSFRETSLSGSVIPEFSLEPPDLKTLKMQDDSDARMEKPYRVGVLLEAQLDMLELGSWQDLSDGSRICRLIIECKGAQAIGIDYKEFSLPKGAVMYVYSSDHSHVTGGFTSESCFGTGNFFTRPVTGDKIVLEYNLAGSVAEPGKIQISGINFIYRGWDLQPEKELKNFGGSGSCEVNVSCSEGIPWRSQTDGVVRILSRVKNQSFWCTGVVVNNTNLDYAPLILTANHCSESGSLSSTPSDLLKWTFYFNYESNTCEDPVYEPAEHSMVGAVKLSSSAQPVEIGSDFFLLRLSQMIPAEYRTFYNGWSAEDAGSVSGVGIHHPEGDIKKISTYETSLQSGNWQSIPNTHWIVQWALTSNGHGVTEPGSSGSPIFNSNGLLIGTLTGGESGCTNADGKDYYGKFSFSWESNGSVDTIQLKPWLDPAGLGNKTLQGTYNTKVPLADFEADTTTVVVGGSLDFFDRSSHDPISWEWHFEGGEPAVSTDKNPSGIRFDSCGQYTVQLKVANQFGTDTVVKTAYVNVKAKIYPNPTQGQITIFTNATNAGHTIVKIYTPAGKLVSQSEWKGPVGKYVELDMPKAGKLFYLELIQDENIQVFPVIVFTPNVR